MIALGTVLLEVLCCLGLGAAALRILKIDADMDVGEHRAIAFAVGFGVLGWAVFPLGVAGYLSEGPLTILLSAGAVGAVLLRRKDVFVSPVRLDAMGRVLLALLGLIFVFDFLEGVAPPADADTLAYHFNNPKRFLDGGRIAFIPLPLEGAVPMGVQMTYVPALALGGELALTLWTTVSGWIAGGVLFVLCRRYLNFNWSLAVVLIFLTTPTVVYGGGSGQVETRIALFVMIAAWATVRAIETGRIRYAVLAGLGGGFYAGAKYTGLLFAAVCGVVLLVQRRWLAHGAAFGIALLAAGVPWYAWNAIHTGDPVFPALFQWLGREDLAFWTKTHDLFYKQDLFKTENPLPQFPAGFLFYPFSATLGIGPTIDAGRVGWGPYGLLVMPFAALGVWRFRERARRSPLFVFASFVVLFYVLWFFFGGSQRIRHLVPILPLFLICITVAAERWTSDGLFRGPLLASIAVSILLQAGIHGLFALNYLRYLTQDADREAFLTRNVHAYKAVPWINTNLTPEDRILFRHRPLRYFLDVPSLVATHGQALVGLHPDRTDTRELYQELRSAGVTHLMLNRSPGNRRPVYWAPLNLLYEAGCLTRMKNFKFRKFSRTLPTLSSNVLSQDMLKLRDKSCLE